MQCLDCSKLTGHLHSICSGSDKLKASKRNAYIKVWLNRGLVTVVECSDKKIHRTYVKPQLPGTELTKCLAWIKAIKPEKAKCSCTTLASEMDADGVAKCRQRRDSYYLPKMLQNKTAITDAMKAEGGLLGVAGFVGGLIPDAVALPWLRAKFDAACDAAEVKKPQARRSVSPRLTRSGMRRGGVFGFDHSQQSRFITSAQLAIDTKLLLSKIPSDITAIAGVARSGLSVATMLAMYLHLPMITIRQTMNDVVDTGNGWRLGGSHHVNPKRGKVLVVDDTVMTGNSIKAIRPLVQRECGEHLFAAVYVNPKAAHKPDIYAIDLPWPHILEWNVFNSVLSSSIAMDFDGILCHDCPVGSDDDGERYLQFIENAQPLYVPRKAPVPLIVTARIEKYRQPTEAWLQRHNIKFSQLIMHPAATLRERERDDIAGFKARHFQSWLRAYKAQVQPQIFFESEDRQARKIALMSGGLVICPHTAGVYGPQNSALPDML